MKNVSCEYDRWVVETPPFELRDIRQTRSLGDIFIRIFTNMFKFPLADTHPLQLYCIQSTTIHIYTYIYNMFFWPVGIFFSFVRGSFLVLSAPWHARSPPGPRMQVWALAEVHGTCSGGSKSQVCSGRDSEHVQPSRPLKTRMVK